VNYKNSKIFIDELKRTFPVYILGMIFHAIVIYILYKIPSIIGKILDLLTEGNVSREVIMNEVYSLIFYSIIMIIPRIAYRFLFFTRARMSDTYLRSKVIEYLQIVINKKVFWKCFFLHSKASGSTYYRISSYRKEF